VYELPSGEESETGRSAGDGGGFGRGFSNSGLRKRYHVAWSPSIPAVISTCAFDRSVQFYSLSGILKVISTLKLFI
jgi:hypothetical protein